MSAKFVKWAALSICLAGMEAQAAFDLSTRAEFYFAV